MSLKPQPIAKFNLGSTSILVLEGSLSEMERMIGQVSMGSKETEAITWQVASDAEQGVKAVTKTIEGIGRIHEDSLGVSEVITRLGQWGSHVLMRAADPGSGLVVECFYTGLGPYTIASCREA